MEEMKYLPEEQNNLDTQTIEGTQKEERNYFHLSEEEHLALKEKIESDQKKKKAELRKTIISISKKVLICVGIIAILFTTRAIVRSIPTSIGIEYTLNRDGKGYSVSTPLINEHIIRAIISPKHIVIPDTHDGLPVTSIGGNYNFNDPFTGLKSLESVTIPDSVTSIANGAFSGCTSLEKVSIPNSVISIGDGAFSGCTSLEKISIPNSVTSIGDGAFVGCSSLQYNEYNTEYHTAYYLGNSDNPYVLLVNVESKDAKNNAEFYEIHENTKFIGSYAFSNCSTLKSVSIHGSVISIGSGAFSDCKSLSIIYIDDSVTSIGDNAFYNCNLLSSIRFNGTVAQWNEINKEPSWDLKTGNFVIHCTDGEIAKSGTVTYY